MEYQLIKGLRRNAQIVWSPTEQFLYARQCERNDKIEHICYQKILYDQYIIKKNTEKMKKKNKKKNGKKHNKSKVGKSEKLDKERKENKEEMKVLNCTARVKIDKKGNCTRNNVPHSRHDNHENIYNEMVTKNGIIDKCVEFKKVAKGLSIKVPANDIFTLELSK